AHACGVVRATRPTPRRALVAVAPDCFAHRYGEIVPRALEPRMDGEGAPEHRRRLAVPAERHVAEPLPRQRPEVVRVARERLLAVGDRALVVLGHVADGRALVPALGERGRLLDHLREDRLGPAEIAPLHRPDALAHERVDPAAPRAAPHLPPRRL